MSYTPADPQTQALVEQTRHDTIAAMLISGKSVSAIAEELGITRSAVNKITKTPEFKAHLQDISESMVSTAVNSWKSSMSHMIGKAMAVVERKLDEGELEAVKIILRSLGMDNKQETSSTGTLQIILPEYQKSAKEIKAEVKE